MWLYLRHLCRRGICPASIRETQASLGSATAKTKFFLIDNACISPWRKAWLLLGSQWHVDQKLALGSNWWWALPRQAASWLFRILCKQRQPSLALLAKLLGKWKCSMNGFFITIFPGQYFMQLLRPWHCQVMCAGVSRMYHIVKNSDCTLSVCWSLEDT